MRVPRVRLVNVAALFLSVAFAACTSAAPASQAPTSSAVAVPSDAPPPTDELGVLAGKVVDDEARPVPGAKVAILKPSNVTETASDGSFSFPPLAPGTYDVVVEKLGFESVGRKATVVAGETLNLTIGLVPMGLDSDAYYVIVPKTALVNVGNVFVQDVVEIVNQSVLNQLVCDPCRFPIHFAPGPEEVVIEATWSNPGDYLNEDVWIYYQIDWTTGSYLNDGTNIYATYHNDREVGRFTDTAVKAVAKEDRVLLGVMPGYFVSFQMRVDTYTTFAYGAEVAEEFTALPPK